MKPLAGAEVSDFGTRFGFEAGGSMSSEREAVSLKIVSFWRSARMCSRIRENSDAQGNFHEFRSDLSQRLRETIPPMAQIGRSVCFCPPS